MKTPLRARYRPARCATPTDGSCSPPPTSAATSPASLRRAAALGEIERPPPYDDPRAEVLKQRGIEHERRLLERFVAEGRTVETIIPGDTPVWQRDPEAAAASTRQAMQRGVDIVYQGRLQDDDGRWSRYPDFLLRVDEASALVGWSYEVLDAKLARVAKGEALLLAACGGSSSTYASIRRSPLGSGMGSPNSLAVSIQRSIA